MKKGKRTIALIVMTLAISMLLSACTFTFALDGCTGLSGCSFEKCGQELMPKDPTPTVDETGQTAFTFVLEERDSFYYPTFKGTVCFTYHPDKITLQCVNKEMTLVPTDMKIKSDGTYLFTFEQDVIYTHLEPGEYTARVIGYKGKVSTITEESTVFVVDDYYSGFNGMYDIDWDDPNAEIKYITAMDKDKNWTPPY